YTVKPGQSLAQIAERFFGDPAAESYLAEFNSDLLPPDGRPVAGQVLRIPAVLDVESKVLAVPSETAAEFPSGDRFDISFIDLLNAGKRIGSPNFPQDADGIIRRSPTAVYFASAGQVYPSLTMAAAMDLLDVPSDGLNYDLEKRRLSLVNRAGETVREIPTDDQGRLLVNYYGLYRTFRYIPYAWVNPDMLPPEYFKDKVVIIGSTLAGLMDLRSTPVQETFPGVEIHANVMLSLLRNEFVEPVSRLAGFTLVVMIGLLLGGLIIHFRITGAIALSLAAMALWIIFAYSRFLGALVVYEIVRPLMSFGFVFLSVNLYQYLVLEKDKRFLRKSFSTYISPDLIDDMIAAGVEPELGGESDILTAYFTDIQSFSSFSEILTASKLVELLNEYLTAMTEVLLDQGGTLDKYEGDAIVAFFGAPMPMEDHAVRGLRTALEMQRRLGDLRRKWASEGDKWPDLVHIMRTRIGLNTGEFVTGNMGSTTRMNYTMMGDIVNTAARLEASAKQYGIYIQCTTQTLNSAGRDAFEWRDIDKVKVMGKSEAVETVEVMASKGQLDPKLMEMKEIYQSGMEAYRRQSWDDARKLFTSSKALEEVFTKRPTTPSQVYIERCDYFKANPPGDDWDSSWTLTSK
ncbi:MAG: CHASE2 domain-containing protein, partial [Candidatus Marinimicrobia bacterium]|nr:CHASE2 domain-containing protein [Candidatus Neomarinimicrobiota bacterium]